MATDGTSEVDLTGDLDIATRGEVLQLVDDALARAGIIDLVVDLAGVTFLDSSEIGSLVQMRIKAARGRRLDARRQSWTRRVRNPP